MSGWIKLHRSLQDSAIASHPEYLAVWVHLMLRAQHSASECVIGRQIVKLSVGQLVFGRVKFSSEIGVSENKVRAALDVMKSLNMITIKSMAKFSIISIVKWSEYQTESPANNQETASNAPAPNQHPATYKNDKNVNNDKNEKNLLVTPSAPPEKKLRKTGSRLPDDWRPTQEHVEAAMQLNPDYTREWFSSTAHKFRDYWVAKTGKDATKADWLATWRNWVRNDLEYNRGKANAKPKQLDNESTDWVSLAFGSTTSGDSGEQDLQWLEGDFSSLGGGDQRPGLPKPSEGGMVEGLD
jgi:type IV secretory pathway VirB10-like protein